MFHKDLSKNSVLIGNNKWHSETINTQEKRTKFNRELSPRSRALVKTRRPLYGLSFFQDGIK